MHPHGSFNGKVGFLNNLSLNGVYNHYDYGPVKNRAFFDLYYIYPNPKIAIFEKGNPYMAASINYVSLNPGFGVYLGDNHIIQNTQWGSEPSLKTSTVNISFGLLFETFDISYNFLNLGGDYYSMIGANSDLGVEVAKICESRNMYQVCGVSRQESRNKSLYEEILIVSDYESDKEMISDFVAKHNVTDIILFNGFIGKNN